MNTQWSSGSRRRKCSAWSRISAAVRFRPKRICPVAQNEHVSGQPDCDDTQIDRRPSPKRIRTASTGLPSDVRKSAFTVPSRETASRSSASVEKGTLSASASRSAAGTFVIAS
jgi:hypothetical protein